MHWRMPHTFARFAKVWESVDYGTPAKETAGRCRIVTEGSGKSMRAGAPRSRGVRDLGLVGIHHRISVPAITAAGNHFFYADVMPWGERVKRAKTQVQRGDTLRVMILPVPGPRSRKAARPGAPGGGR